MQSDEGDSDARAAPSKAVADPEDRLAENQAQCAHGDDKYAHQRKGAEGQEGTLVLALDEIAGVLEHLYEALFEFVSDRQLPCAGDPCIENVEKVFLHGPRREVEAPGL